MFEAGVAKRLRKKAQQRSYERYPGNIVCICGYHAVRFGKHDKNKRCVLKNDLRRVAVDSAGHQFKA